MSLTPSTMLALGTKAPDFSLPDQEGAERRLTDFRNKIVLLAFYPFDFSPVCTTEFKCFEDDLSELKELNVQVIGISVDSKYSHKEFAAKHGLTFPLLSDFGRSVSRLYGTLRDDGFSNRAYFIIDRHGILKFKKIMEAPKERMESRDIIKTLKKI